MAPLFPKKDKLARSLLSVRREQLENELEVALVENRLPRKIGELNEALTAAREAEKRRSQPQRRVLLLGFFSVLATVSIIGIGVYFRIPIATIKLEARTTAIMFETAESGIPDGMGFQSTEPFTVDKITKERLVGDLEIRGQSKIHLIDISPGTRLRLTFDDSVCMAMTILEARESLPNTGVNIQLISSTTSAGAILRPEIFAAESGEVIRLCGAPSGEPFLIGRTAALSLIRVVHEDNPPLEASSIVDGVLTIAEISERRTLSPSDRLILDNLNEAELVIFREKGSFNLFLSGRAVAARLMGGDQSPEGEDLIPNLLAFATRSPLALLLGLALGLVGTFWNAVKFFFRLDH